MASALLVGRQVPLGVRSQRHSTRASAFRSRPVPFTPIRRVVARAQGVDAAEETASLVEADEQIFDEDVSELLEADVIGELGAFASDADRDAVDDEDVADLEAAMQAAELLAMDVDMATAAGVSAELDEDEEEKQVAARFMEEQLSLKLASEDQAVTEADMDIVAAGVSAEELTEISLEDPVPVMASDRYDERPLSAEERELIQPVKLSKGELRNLLPADWDQINVDFFSNKKQENIRLPEFRLNVLWTEKNLIVAIDQVYSRGQVSPLTNYYLWPRQDAWEDLRVTLEERPWIAERDRIILLNRLTQLINFWQDEEVKHSLEEARAEFPDCYFAAA
ncbi:hypothetical protein Agub_g11498 [Astrephomene gubernaculifera]|uniref:30S ribosomal protein 3, chloroplastic n=1 Tax=Astrephomene gubernaculifera TaxID=47775 RepID=A0AAD3DWL6_9CHLO|nr:hypothetical protein Agub_g11498 [Astrephomene gubernaculifera]